MIEGDIVTFSNGCKFRLVKPWRYAAVIKHSEMMKRALVLGFVIGMVIGAIIGGVVI